MERISPEIYICDRQFTDLNPVLCGSEQLKPHQIFGPGIRDCYLIHYIVSGSGIFENPRGTYFPKPGEVFIIRPGEVISYCPVESDPWHYIWIGFTGRLASMLDELPDVMQMPNCERFPAMLECKKLDSMREEYLTGQIFLMLTELVGSKSASSGNSPAHMRPPGFIELTANFIDRNYMSALSVEKIAADLNIDRRYLSRIFKRERGMTVKEYITHVKMTHARGFLKAGCSVERTAAMTGYADSFSFSKMFKKFYGYNPSDVRRERIDGTEPV